MTVRRSLLVAALVTGLLAAPAAAGDSTDEPTEPAVIAEGVTIAGLDVAGLTWQEARAAVRGSFDRPLTFGFRHRRWHVLPRTLNARADVRGAVRRAVRAMPGAEVHLVVRVDRARVARYAASLARRYSRVAKDASVLLRKLRPIITRSRPGRKVRTLVLRSEIGLALRRHDRRRIFLQVRVVRPAVTRATFGPIVVIRRESKRLVLYRRTRRVARFHIATGQPSYPTPLGHFSIVVMERNPWWNPPDSDWAQGAQPIPPGPGNPLGTRWMGLSAPGIGIHGTPDAASIGYSASHGCIRMRIREAEWLFKRVRIGTPVFIVRA